MKSSLKVLMASVVTTLALCALSIQAVHAQQPKAPVTSPDGKFKVGDKLKPTAPAPAPAAAATVRTITWDDLMPKNWDPSAAVKNLNFGIMSDSDPRAIKALEELRKAWANAPVVPTLKGQTIRIPGFVVPLDQDAKKNITEFLLVPYFGACIHTPPPPSNQIIHVMPKAPIPTDFNMIPVWIVGTIDIARYDSVLGTAGYKLSATNVVKYDVEKENSAIKDYSGKK